jgi:7-carboxy-7-deazaguanine synthase
MKALPVHERFLAFQGEGNHLGRKAFFIRLFGCPVKCPWCDSAGTWHKDWVPKHVERMSPVSLAEEVLAAAPEFVVLTGGEPTVHNLDDLCAEIAFTTNLPIHVETCGGFFFNRVPIDWITLSPKWDKLPVAINLVTASELKLIVEDKDSIDKWLAKLSEIAGGDIVERCRDNKVSIWLHPEWSRRDDPEVLNAISTAVLTHGSPLRAGWQLHKLYKVDALDKRTAQLAPLGGNEERYGY